MATLQKVNYYITKNPQTRNITIERIEKFIQSSQFSDVNLYSTLWKKHDSSCITLSVYSVPELKRMQVGESFGPTWSTHWFKVGIDIPESYSGEKVLLLLDTSSESLVWSEDGTPLQALVGGDVNERHVDFLLTEKAKGGEHFQYYIEMACNSLFGAGKDGDISPPDVDRYYKLRDAKIAVRNQIPYDLYRDIQVYLGLIKDVNSESQLSRDALYTANKIVNVFRYDLPESWSEAQNISRDFFKNHSMQGSPLHEITAIGNCHIDTAWLWPYDETKRKAARSWATQCGLMEQFPQYVFAASQAQQFEWVEALYPKLFEKIKAKAKTGNFIPIGGTWVEMDCNLPSGEALCRQFLYGQRYFESRFGERCSVFWLPDTFGYSAQLPQIISLSGLKYFFTQKLSWNNINVFPHTTFMWSGLDGTSILTHFSPANTYTAWANVNDAVRCVENNKDKEFSNKSLLVYGYGDGGGGPLDHMLERIDRMSRLEGMPASIKYGSPNDFYKELEATSKDLVSWKGELYFELHRGTYTTHAKIKEGNRKGELTLRAVEILSTIACIRDESFKNPKSELDRLWKLLLLNQFHDVLPGSSIEIAYDDPLKFYKDILRTGKQLITDAWKVVQKSFANEDCIKQGLVVFNPTSWTRTAEIVEFDIDLMIPNAERLLNGKFHQMSADGKKALVLVDNVPGMAIKTYAFGNMPNQFSPVQVFKTNDSLFSFQSSDEFIVVNKAEDNVTVVQNSFIRVSFDKHGRIVSLVDKAEQREVILPGSLANVFKYFEDIPLFWDAWDVEIYHLQKSWDAGVGMLVISESGPLRVVLKIDHPLSETSTLSQTITINAVSAKIEFDNIVNWNENRRFLKVEFPVNINCDVATYETQFGFIQRPTHFNNSWDFAKFEVCGHKFIDYSEYGYGVSLLNDCKYGFSVHGNIMRMSILRSPKSPDAHCDIGTHSFKYALVPHKGTFTESNAVQHGYEFNVPLIISPVLVNPTETFYQQFFSINKSNVVIDTIKVAEDPKGLEIVIRLYEAYGGRGTALLTSTVPILAVNFCNILEDNEENVEIDETGALVIPYTPFKIISLKIKIK